MITIFQAILRWGIPALAGGIAVSLLLAFGYLVYKKVFHGKKAITKLQAASAFLLSCWMILVIGLTSLSRGANYTGEINIDFFSGYINAWNKWSISELQLIIFNMLMFAPLGFLLPVLWKKAEKIWITAAVSLGLTTLIEATQLFKTIDRIIIEPKETFSFWQLARWADRNEKYKDGLPASRTYKN